MAAVDMNGTPITEGATGFLIGDRAGFNARVVDPDPDQEPGHVLADLIDPTGAITFYSSVLVPASKLRLDGEESA